jgi:hypothetical protein
MGIEEIEEGEEVQAKRIHNVFNKILIEIFQISRKFCPFKYREQRKNTEGCKREKTKNVYR